MPLTFCAGEYLEKLKDMPYMTLIIRYIPANAPK